VNCSVESALNVDLRKIFRTKTDPQTRISDANAPFMLIHLLDVQPVIKHHLIENALILQFDLCRRSVRNDSPAATRRRSACRAWLLCFVVIFVHFYAGSTVSALSKLRRQQVLEARAHAMRRGRPNRSASCGRRSGQVSWHAVSAPGGARWLRRGLLAPAERLVVEVDGVQHRSRRGAYRRRDARRGWLSSGSVSCGSRRSSFWRVRRRPSCGW
jgi:hypothetical protein